MDMTLQKLCHFSASQFPRLPDVDNITISQVVVQLNETIQQKYSPEDAVAS